MRGGGARGFNDKNFVAEAICKFFNFWEASSQS